MQEAPQPNWDRYVELYGQENPWVRWIAEYEPEFARKVGAVTTGAEINNVRRGILMKRIDNAIEHLGQDGGDCDGCKDAAALLRIMGVAALKSMEPEPTKGPSQEEIAAGLNAPKGDG